MIAPQITYPADWHISQAADELLANFEMFVAGVSCP